MVGMVNVAPVALVPHYGHLVWAGGFFYQLSPSCHI